MKPEYVEEMKKLGVPWSEDYIWDRINALNNECVGEIDLDFVEFAILATNNYHALKNAVEELRDAAKETLGAWHGGTMNDVRAAMTLMEEALKETEGL
jgi:hypothetical protein